MLRYLIDGQPGWRSAEHTAWNTFCTWHWANAVLLRRFLCPSDLAPLPLPGSVALQPSTGFGPWRQRLIQLSSGVTNPCGKLPVLMWYFGLRLPGV